MPLPFIIGAGAVIAGVAGVGSGVHGGVKMKKANDHMKMAENTQKEATERFESVSNDTNRVMDRLGKKELKILNSFEEFANLIDRIQNKPQFEPYSKNGVKLPEYNPEELKHISVGAGVLLGGIGGAAAGTAGGFAAAGATTAAVMALGSASTGTAIASLSGVAATNATLAALGGGSLAAGGGGMALGSAVLGGATLGVGLLVGGIIFNHTGKKMSDKADEAIAQAEETKKTVNKIVCYLQELTDVSCEYLRVLNEVDRNYKRMLKELNNTVNVLEKTDWNEFSQEEKDITENAVLLVGLLYKMCQVQLVLKSDNEEMNEINYDDIEDMQDNAKDVLNNGLK